jgi:hypothetical protein
MEILAIVCSAAGHKNIILMQKSLRCSQKTIVISEKTYFRPFFGKSDKNSADDSFQQQRI